MTDKQRADHVQAKYWNGFVTRTEVQSIFNQYAAAQNNQGVALQKMDAVLSFLCSKFGIDVKEIEAWINAKIEEASKTPLEKAVEASPNTAQGTGQQLVTEN